MSKCTRDCSGLGVRREFVIRGRVIWYKPLTTLQISGEAALGGRPCRPLPGTLTLQHGLTGGGSQCSRWGDSRGVYLTKREPEEEGA